MSNFIWNLLSESAELQSSTTQTLSPSGIASTVSFGTLSISLYIVPTGISSGNAIGTPALTIYIVPSGISSTVAFGTATLKLYIVVSGIASTISFGTLTISIPGGAPQTITVTSGIASTVSFGTPQLNFIIYPATKSSGNTLGTPALSLYLVPTGIVSTVSFGTPTIKLYLVVGGIASTVSFGSPIVSAGQVFVVISGIASTVVFGTPNLTSSIQQLYPSSISSNLAFGVLDIFNSLWGDPRMPYATPEHFERFFEGFGTAYYGTQSQNGTGTLEINLPQFQADIASSYANINIKLDGISRIPVVPVGTQSNGSFNQYLIDWNVYDVIYTKLRARHLFQFGDNLPEWIRDFGTRSDGIEKMIRDGAVTFEADTTTKGIGYPIRVYGTSIAKFYSNWDTGYYDASDYPKQYHFKITGTTDGTNPGFAKFQYSKDSGNSYLTTELTTGTDWQSIEHGLEIRWALTAGTLPQLQINDEWKVTCTPVNIRSISGDSQYKTFGRG